MSTLTAMLGPSPVREASGRGTRLRQMPVGNAAGDIRFSHTRALWNEYPDRIRALVQQPDIRRVCDLGGGARPLLTRAEIEAAGVDYDLMDVSAEQLAKAPPGYRTIVADALAPEFAHAHGPYDLVFTSFVVEHLPDPAAFHRNVHSVLRPGGLAFHVFPTLFEPAFLFNYVVPDELTAALLHRVQPGREEEGAHGKFRPYYRWCRGPGPRQIERFGQAGFDVVEYVGYFGHHYFERFPPVERAFERVWSALLRRPVPAVTSYAWVLLRRTGEAPAAAAS